MAQGAMVSRRDSLLKAQGGWTELNRAMYAPWVLHGAREGAGIARVWQWVRYGAKLDTGKVVTAELVRKVVDEEMQAARQQLGDDKFASSEFLDAAFLTKLMCVGKELHDFLTLPAQDIIIAMGM
ncbi:hypothetical protein N2152v2_003223 [Parachlorella kessleri]